MNVEMDLIKLDPKLGITPYLMEHVENDVVNLDSYINTLMRDLVCDAQPILRAISIAKQGNVNLAKRYIANMNLSDSDLYQFTAQCEELKQQLLERVSSIDTRMKNFLSNTGSIRLDDYRKVKLGWEQAIKQERYHKAFVFLAGAEDLLGKFEKEEEPRESLDILDSTPVPPEETQTIPSEVKPHTTVEEKISTETSEQEQQDGIWFAEAVSVWKEFTEGFDSPLRELLRPKQQSERISFLDVAELLRDIENLSFDRKDVEFAFSSYFFLSDQERKYLSATFAKAVLVFGEKTLERFVLQDKDFDTAWLVYIDLILLGERSTKLNLSDHEEVHRLGFEAKAALLGKELVYAWESFTNEAEALALEARFHRKQQKKFVSLGKMYFFHYRIRELEKTEKYDELIDFFVKHNPEVVNFINQYPQLSRVYEIAQHSYRSAQIGRAEDDLLPSKFIENNDVESVLEVLAKANPYQLVSLLNIMVVHFENASIEPNAPLLTMCKLLSILFSIEKIEEVVFVEEDILNLTQILEMRAIGEHVPINLASGAISLHVGVLQSLRQFIRQVIAAVSMTDLHLIRDHIARATEQIQEQRRYFHTMDAATRHLWHMLGDRWISLLVGLNRALSRQTKLELTLLQSEVVSSEISSIVATIRNIGQHTAKHIEIALTSSDVELIEKSSIKRINYLRPGDENTVTYKVKPIIDANTAEIRLLVRYHDADENPTIDYENRTLRITTPKKKKFPMISPYVWGQPLPKQSKIFYGREDVFEFLRTRFFGEERNKVFAIQGERRMGKTSVLYQLGPRNIFGNSRIVFFDLQGRYANVKSIPEFLYNFARRIRSEARLPDRLKVSEPEFQLGYGKYFEVFEKWLDDVEEFLEKQDTRIIIVFDEFETLLARRLESKIPATQEFVEELLQYIRSLVLKRTKINWVIAGSWGLATKQRDYFSSLFGMTLSYWIGYLKQEDAIKLIQEPVQEYLYYEQDATDRILRLTGGHPFHIQIMCDELLQRARESNNTRVTVGDVNEVIEYTLAQVTQESFRMIWSSLGSSISRKLLAAVAEAAESNQATNNYVNTEDVLKYIRRNDPRINEEESRKAIDIEDGELIIRGLLQVHPVETNRMRIRSELFYRWLRKVKPLKNVLREER